MSDLKPCPFCQKEPPYCCETFVEIQHAFQEFFSAGRYTAEQISAQAPLVTRIFEAISVWTQKEMLEELLEEGRRKIPSDTALVFDRVLTNSERELLEKHMGDRYSIGVAP